MGDCRIRIAIDRSLFDEEEDTTRAESGGTVQLREVESSLFAADTTIADCFAAIHLNKDDHTNSTSVPSSSSSSTTATIITVWSILDRVSVWDCTSFPTKNITPLCTGADAGRTTLFTAGWFPSGTLQLLRPDAPHSVAASAASYQDTQYNVLSSNVASLSTTSAPGRRVDVNGVRTDALPSQVIHSVVDRHAELEVPLVEQEKARQMRLVNKRKQLERQRERGQRLEQRIQRLQAKTSSTSAQVRNMLIKSRATGRSNLQQEDRIYFHCCVVWDDTGTETTTDESYRFFSLQDTVGRALDHLRSSSPPSANNSHHDVSLEMLVHSISAGEYRRLPTTLVFQDAVHAGYLTGRVDTVVLRYFNAEDGATTDITEDLLLCGDQVPKANGTPSARRTENTLAQQQPVSTTSDCDAGAPGARSAASDASTEELLSCLQRIKFKAKSPAAHKVRQMKMKNKAKGDAKRVGDMSKRFFVELIVVIVDTAAAKKVATSEGYFFSAHHDPVDRFLRDYCSKVVGASSSWSLCSYDGDQQQVTRLASSSDETMISWEDAEKAKLVRPFDQVILQMHFT